MRPETRIDSHGIKLDRADLIEDSLHRFKYLSLQVCNRILYQRVCEARRVNAPFSISQIVRLTWILNHFHNPMTRQSDGRSKVIQLVVKGQRETQLTFSRVEIDARGDGTEGVLKLCDVSYQLEGTIPFAELVSPNRVEPLIHLLLDV